MLYFIFSVVLKRYPFPQQVFLFMSSLSIMGGFAIYLWNFRRTGFSLEKILAGILLSHLWFSCPIRLSWYNNRWFKHDCLLLLSVSVDKDDDNLITALFYFKLVVAMMVLLAYNGHLIHDVSGIRSHTEIVRHSYGFMHPNSLGMFFITLIYDFSLLRKPYRFVGGIIMLLAALLVFQWRIQEHHFYCTWYYLVLFLKPILSKIKVSGYVIMPFVIGMFALGLALPRYFTPDNPILLHWIIYLLEELASVMRIWSDLVSIGCQEIFQHLQRLTVFQCMMIVSMLMRFCVRGLFFSACIQPSYWFY